MMEPALNPALEAQAIGRVHRLGQVNPVEVTRFAIKNSIEERILKMQSKKYGSRAVGEGAGEGAAGSAGAAGAAGAAGVARAAGPITRGGGRGAKATPAVIDLDDDEDEFLGGNGAGHLSSDKVQAKQDEFDLIFNVTAADLAVRNAELARRRGEGGGGGGGGGGPVGDPPSENAGLMALVKGEAEAVDDQMTGTVEDGGCWVAPP